MTLDPPDRIGLLLSRADEALDATHAVGAKVDALRHDHMALIGKFNEYIVELRKINEATMASIGKVVDREGKRMARRWPWTR